MQISREELEKLIDEKILRSNINKILFNSEKFSLKRFIDDVEDEHARYVMKVEKATGNVSFYRYSEPSENAAANEIKFLDIDAVNEEVTLTKNGEEIKLSKSGLPVGSIIQSFLSVEKFQLIHGKNWVLCNGADCKNTRFSELTGLAKLPDSSGKFLRSAGGKAANLGDSQGEATAVNGLSNASSQVTGGTFGGTITEHTPINTDAKSHSHNLTYYDYSWGDNRGGHGGEAARAQNSSVVGDGSKGSHPGGISNSGSHSHTIPKHSHGFTGSISGTRTAAAQNISSTDTETRPENVTVNTFVRIN